MRFLKIFLLAATVITNAHITTDAFAYARREDTVDPDTCANYITRDSCNNIDGCAWTSSYAAGTTAQKYCKRGDCKGAGSNCEERAGCNQRTATTCYACTEGYYCEYGVASEIACSAGSYCPTGSAYPYPCPAGYYCSSPTEIEECPAGYYCPERTHDLTNYLCPTTHPFSPGNATAKSQCYYQIPAGYEYDTTTNAHTSCHAGGYCPGAQMTYGTTKDEYGWTPCTTNGQDGRTINSPTGAQRPTQCYVICPTKTIDHGRQTAPNVNAAADSAGNYYYPTCTYTTTCDTGYHVSGSACIANTYTVKFNKGTKPGNASGEIQRPNYSDIYSQTLTYDIEYALTPVRFSLTGWTFANWCTNNTGDCGTKYTDGQTVKNLTTANNGLIDLYPRWTPDRYTITLNQNNATTNGTGTLYTIYDTGVYIDSARTKRMTTLTNPITTPQREYTVTLNPAGGSVSPTELTATYTFNGFYKDNEETLYIDSNGKITADGVTAAKESANGTTWTAKWTSGSVNLPSPTRTGYTFAGWEVPNTNQQPGSTYTPTANVTLTATWNPNRYTITLNNNGGDGGSGTVTEVYNTKWTNSSGTTITSVTKPTRTGYTFKGYYTATTGGTWKIPASGVLPLTTTFTANTTLYAQWTPCPQGSYCPGDNTRNQCPTAFYSDAGATDITQCYLKTNIKLTDKNATGISLFPNVTTPDDSNTEKIYYIGANN